VKRIELRNDVLDRAGASSVYLGGYRMIAYFLPKGLFPLHCHDLLHEDLLVDERTD
jgi:hypothetical protein